MLQGMLCEDAHQALQLAGPFLEADAARNTVILTLLNERQADRQPMRAWILRRGGETAGFAFLSPLAFDVNLVAMGEDATDAMAGLIAGSAIALTAVRGPAATVTRFAGAWLDRTGIGARPIEASRIFEATAPVATPDAPGALRCATAADRPIVFEMMTDFLDETGGRPVAFDRLIDTRLAAGRYWLWWTPDGAVSLAGVSAPVAGVVRIQASYTRLQWRNRAYSSACIGTLTQEHRTRGLRCVLFADLDNPVSNHLFTKIGYRPIGEELRYQFLSHP